MAKAKSVAIEHGKVEDIADIMAYGVTSIPGVVIDGQAAHTSGVPDRQAKAVK